MTTTPRAKIGVVVVGHGQLAPAMVDAAVRIIADADNICSVAIDSNAPLETSRQQVTAAVASVNRGSGVLLLTDMFGGTPSNVCLSFLAPGEVEVVSGVNLPMLIKLLGGLQTEAFPDVANFIQRYGQKNIVIASCVLGGKLD